MINVVLGSMGLLRVGVPCFRTPLKLGIIIFFLFGQERDDLVNFGTTTANGVCAWETKRPNQPNKEEQ